MMGVGAAGPLGQAPRQGDDVRPLDRSWRGLHLRALDVGEERPYWIALHAVPGMGPVTFAGLLHRFGSARAAWAIGEALAQLMPRPTPSTLPVLRRLQRAGAQEVARRASRLTMAAGGTILTALDDAYPRALSELDPRPAVLYAAGDLTAFDEVCVAIVGTRRASSYGLASAAHLADELGRAGAVVVSGLALGIDGEAHRAAIDAGGRSIAVLPSPLDRVYPPRHRNLARRLVTSGGILVSEIGPGQSIGKPDFARRNRIIAGLASAVVVVEAPNGSGALLTAQAALNYERALYAVPGPMDAAGAAGPHRLIADRQADLITSPAALLHQVGVHRPAGPISVATLSDGEGLVLHALLSRAASIEELIRPTGLSPGAVAGTLTLLEARGLVTSYGGVTFHPTAVARRLGHRDG